MVYVDDLNKRQFLVADALRAMPREVPLYSFKNWTRRPAPAIPLDEDDSARLAAGELRYLHMRHLQQIAIVAELTAYGIAPRRAGLWASHFTNGGSSYTVDGERRVRRAGELFDTRGATMLIAGADDKARVVWVRRQDDPMDGLHDGRTFRRSMLRLWLNPIVNELRQHFGLVA
jgi:hypothetical protein